MQQSPSSASQRFFPLVPSSHYEDLVILGESFFKQWSSFQDHSDDEFRLGRILQFKSSELWVREGSWMGVPARCDTFIRRVLCVAFL